jgi:hypothetical protein
MTTMDRRETRCPRAVVVLMVMEAVIAAGIAFFGYWELLAYAGPSAGFTLPPTPDPAIVRIYPGFGGSPSPSAVVFGVGLLLMVITLTAIRLSSQPQRGGKLVWRAVLIAGIGMISYFSGVVVAVSGNNFIWPELLIPSGALVMLLAVCMAFAGVFRMIRDRRMNRSADATDPK